VSRQPNLDTNRTFLTLLSQVQVIFGEISCSSQVSNKVELA
jgi:hypothetical protein